MERPRILDTIPSSNGNTRNNKEKSGIKTEIHNVAKNTHPILSQGISSGEHNVPIKPEAMEIETCLGNYEEHKKSGQKRKISEEGNGHINAGSLCKIGKLEMQNGLEKAAQTPADTKLKLGSFYTSSNKTKPKRSLWIMSCDRCTFETDNMEEFTCHIDNLHMDLNDFKCHKCSFATTASTLLNKHLRYEILGDVTNNDLWVPSPILP